MEIVIALEGKRYGKQTVASYPHGKFLYFRFTLSVIIFDSIIRQLLVL